MFLKTYTALGRDVGETQRPRAGGDCIDREHPKPRFYSSGVEGPARYNLSVSIFVIVFLSCFFSSYFSTLDLLGAARRFLPFLISPLPPSVRLASFFAAGVGAIVEHVVKETFRLLKLPASEICCIWMKSVAVSRFICSAEGT